MTNPIGFTGSTPMQWVLALDPTTPNISQTLTVKHGQRSVDENYKIAVEPGVYIIKWERNIPETEWNSFYFRDWDDYQLVHFNFGQRNNNSGSRRVVVPRKCWLYSYVTLSEQIDTYQPVVGMSLIPIAPLANAFEV